MAQQHDGPGSDAPEPQDDAVMKDTMPHFIGVEGVGGAGSTVGGSVAHESMPPQADIKADPSPGVKGPARHAPRDAIIDALLELAGERSWEDITISDVATRANLSLADFRDCFPSKGAVLAAFARRIDREVLEDTGTELMGEPAKERLFDVLMRRLDKLAPYKLGLEGISEWVNRAPFAAAALNGVEMNSMRFMLEAAGIDSEGAVGAVKLQGLVLLWSRILRHWLRDDDPGLSQTMAMLDKDLTRGGKFVSRADDVNRLVSPLLSLARAMFERRPDYPRETGKPFEPGGESARF